MFVRKNQLQVKDVFKTKTTNPRFENYTNVLFYQVCLLEHKQSRGSACYDAREISCSNTYVLSAAHIHTKEFVSSIVRANFNNTHITVNFQVSTPHLFLLSS